jgi:hypothetical protein
MVVEVDAMPGGYVCSASLKGSLATPNVRAAAAGDFPIRKLFTKEQRAFLDAHAPDGISWDDLSILGPINVLKLRFSPEGFARKMVAELWLYPDTSRILELSTKCKPKKALEAMLEARAFLQSRGIDLAGAQQTKTKTALDFFAAESVA